ncbi:hypothetical protein SEA_PANAMAXUS_36 [Mycobacterium phage Panamaxus]|uniref:Lipoprotein n=1 Tax=Mycobacterium phage Veracruz TaxID=2530154 RepID=A0A481VSU0_9CAUD|nr:hypothetical protein KIP27_gp55 [Mycobacterium phage Veracruz]AIS73711.1 hypothetical protein PBI_QUINNKIRO_37 [Mycobacterium phage QuinnKiro]ALA11840.1 hypothetical protein SEA_TEXAGE_37 [Mycobacterium phage Texage]AOT24187.1 hypothetical protein SEA_TODACORO_38 [Mycobacterium phage Todacoro]AOT25540.1 hypothetical protein SEA_MARGO_38 [Mycobacterium phage Margo]AUX82334.1 hypothetical protein SEA_LAMBERT1_38 [Mycobacterium phage Lambert1]AVP42955.1 hypothetical protein SEA_PANAMAXUS_36 [
MKKLIAAVLIGSAALGLTACDGETSGTTDDDTYPHGVIFVPPPPRVGGIGTPIFF